VARHEFGSLATKFHRKQKVGPNSNLIFVFFAPLRGKKEQLDQDCSGTFEGRDVPQPTGK
jgi:hypothetical protein